MFTQRMLVNKHEFDQYICTEIYRTRKTQYI